MMDRRTPTSLCLAPRRRGGKKQAVAMDCFARTDLHRQRHADGALRHRRPMGHEDGERQRAMHPTTTSAATRPTVGRDVDREARVPSGFRRHERRLPSSARRRQSRAAPRPRCPARGRRSRRRAGHKEGPGTSPRDAGQVRA